MIRVNLQVADSALHELGVSSPDAGHALAGNKCKQRSIEQVKLATSLLPAPSRVRTLVSVLECRMNLFVQRGIRCSVSSDGFVLIHAGRLVVIPPPSPQSCGSNAAQGPRKT